MIDYGMYYRQQKGTIAGNWEQVFFLNNVLFYSSLRLAKTLWFSRPWKKQENKILFCFFIPSSKIFCSNILHQLIKKVLPYNYPLLVYVNL
jgi:hypothetical protein